jgi:hypothetical protein
MTRATNAGRAARGSLVCAGLMLALGGCGSELPSGDGQGANGGAGGPVFAPPPPTGGAGGVGGIAPTGGAGGLSGTGGTAGAAGSRELRCVALMSAAPPCAS